MVYRGVEVVGKWSSSSVKFRCMFLIFSSGIAVLYLIASINYNSFEVIVPDNIIRPSFKQQNETEERTYGRFTIHTKGCTIPKLHAFDSNFIKLIEPPEVAPKCPQQDLPLLASNRTHIWVVNHNLMHYAKDKAKFHCCYKPFNRPVSVQDVRSPFADNRVQYEECTWFHNDISVKHEFVRIECYSSNTTIVDVQYFIFAINKTDSLEYYLPEIKVEDPETTEIGPSPEPYNVLILGIDSVSRLNFHRTMPHTLSFLKNKGDVELLGYNKVGDNTFPNVVPMLAGLSESELPHTCWPTGRSTFDNCPFIWNRFKKKGFKTALGEDCADIGTFNYEKFGFINTPTDYYTHPFISEAEGTGTRVINTILCMGNRYFYNVLLDYVESLTSVVRPAKLFGFFWEATMSHDILNYPKGMDPSYKLFFEKMESQGKLEDTIVFFLSDHGIRWGAARMTKQGRLEESLPFVYILTPHSFRKNYPLAYKNLKLNAERLTTPFDIYETLYDLGNLAYITDSTIRERVTESYSNERGISLFLPILGNRTCETAAIKDHWCTCHSGHKVDADKRNVKKAAQFVVSHMNYLLQGRKKCAKLTLEKILEAIELTQSHSEQNEISWQEFLIVVQTRPGDGVFEATVRRHFQPWGDVMSIPATISRVNLYANQSHCIKDFHLKLYCFCI